MTLPVLEDAVLLLIQAKLEAGLSWLTTAYGRAQKLVRRSGNIGEAYYPQGREISFPGIYANSTDGKEYLDMFPDELLGNYSFFDLRDEQLVSDYVQKSPLKNTYKFGVGLVVWFDFRTVYPSPADWKAYSVTNVMKQVFDLLATMTVPGAHIEIDRYYESVENIYRGYSHNEVRNQFANRPYGVFRIEMDITYKPPC